MQPTILTRRQLLRLSGSALLAAGLWPGRLRADDSGGTFRFVVANDLHCSGARCGKWFERVVAQMKADKPDLCLLAGDLGNVGKREELEGVRDVFKTLGAPVYAVMGNHDWKTDFDRKAYEETFPQQINYHFEHKGWQVVGLDTTNGLLWAKIKVQQPTLAWLDETLPKLDKKKPLIVFTHFPLGQDVEMRPDNADDVLARFKEHNLAAIFCGHFHGFTERKAGSTVITTNRCCSRLRGNHDDTKEKGYFLCEAKDGKIERKFVEVKQG